MFRQCSIDLREINAMIIKKIQSIEEEIGQDLHFIVDDILGICKIIQEEILESENNIQWLTPFQNNSRKIEIATELFLFLSLTFNNIVDVQIQKTVYGILNMKKLRQLYSKIVRSRRFELNEQRYFTNLAQSKIVTSHQGHHHHQDDTTTSTLSVNQKTSTKLQKTQLGTIQETPVESWLELQDNISADPSQIRGAQVSGLTHLDLHTEKDPTPQMQDHQLSINAPDLAPHAQQQPKSAGASVTLQDEFSPQIPRMRGPSSETEQTSDTLDELSFESLHLAEPRKRKVPNVTVDSQTQIHNYARRAIKLNRKVNVERVMVFPGPPTLLESFEATHLMMNPSYGLRLISKNRNSKLTALYERHLLVEERECETWSIPDERCTGEIQRKQDQEPKIREMVGRAFSGIFRGSNLGESSVMCEEYIQLRQDYGSIASPPTKSDLGAMAKIKETGLPAHSPSLPGRTLKDSTSSALQKKSCQFIPRVNPPSKKWKEFEYVMSKLEKLWLESDNQNITVKGVLSSENDLNLVNYITLIRVVDKLSLQRKLCLRYKDSDVYITPCTRT